MKKNIIPPLPKEAQNMSFDAFVKQLGKVKYKPRLTTDHKKIKK